MREGRLNPAKALLLGFPVILFLGALLSDLAYYRSFEVQWANFASWLITGALLTGALVLLIGLVDLFRARRGRGRAGLFLVLVAAMWVVGLVNALVHARDGWASMPTGLILSLIVAVLALAAAWAALAGTRGQEPR